MEPARNGHVQVHGQASEWSSDCWGSEVRGGRQPIKTKRVPGAPEDGRSIIVDATYERYER